MKRKGRNHSSAFKAKVAQEALKYDRTLAELSEQFDVHANQIQDWRKRLLGNSDTVFGRGQQQQDAAAGQGPPCEDWSVDVRSGRNVLAESTA